MPRTLDAALLAAMNAGGFTPYFHVSLFDAYDAVMLSTVAVTGFQLDGLSCKVSFLDANHVSYSYFRLFRGVMIGGTPNFIYTLRWAVNVQICKEPRLIVRIPSNVQSIRSHHLCRL